MVLNGDKTKMDNTLCLLVHTHHTIERQTVNGRFYPNTQFFNFTNGTMINITVAWNSSIDFDIYLYSKAQNIEGVLLDSTAFLVN